MYVRKGGLGRKGWLKRGREVKGEGGWESGRKGRRKRRTEKGGSLRDGGRDVGNGQEGERQGAREPGRNKR